MILRIILGIGLLGFLNLSLRGQSDEMQSLITLKDGRQVRGDIVARDTGQSVTLKLGGQSEWVIPESEIAQIEESFPRYLSVNQRRNISFSPLRFPSQGLYGGVMVGMGFPRIFADEFLNNTGGNLSLYLRSGYRLSPEMSIGLVTGLQGLRAGTTFPLMAEINGSLVGRRFGPQFSAQAGWGFALVPRFFLVETLRGGPMGQAGLGWKTFTKGRLCFSFLFGMRYQQTQEVDNVNGWGWWAPVPNQPINPGIIDTRHYMSLFFLGGIEF
ncbi:MAG: hypothetical protein AAF804_09565 [Bacteroidota bacterium]